MRQVVYVRLIVAHLKYFIFILMAAINEDSQEIFMYKGYLNEAERLCIVFDVDNIRFGEFCDCNNENHLQNS